MQDKWFGIIRRQLEKYEGSRNTYRADRHTVRLVRSPAWKWSKEKWSKDGNEVKRKRSFIKWEKLLNHGTTPTRWFVLHPENTADDHAEVEKEVPEKASSNANTFGKWERRLNNRFHQATSVWFHSLDQDH